jgi:hypothetical protein
MILHEGRGAGKGIQEDPDAGRANKKHRCNHVALRRNPSSAEKGLQSKNIITKQDPFFMTLF